MCLVHHEAISLLSNSEQRAVFQLGAISRYPLENGCKLLALALSMSHRKCLALLLELLRGWGRRFSQPCTSAGQQSLCRSSQHITGVWEEEGAPASPNTGARSCFCSLRMSGIQELKEIHRGLQLGPRGWYFFPVEERLCEGSCVLSNHIISLRAITLGVTG